MCTVSTKLREVKYMQLSHWYSSRHRHILLAIEYLKRYKDANHQVLINFHHNLFKQ